ncbi:MAG: glycerate kinase [Bacteroidales bacterium]|nr:glycerate kinase [Bacteroidales bacterium]
MIITVASDSFKGSLSSREVAETVRGALLEVLPGCEVHCLEMADGGEGLVQALAPALGAEFVNAQVHDPLGRPVEARYAVAGERAIIEMAAASGLTLLEKSERDVMKASSQGLGELILDALGRGCRDFIIGIGGSATNDAGTGMLGALGWRFLDSEGKPVPAGGGFLERIARIDASAADGRLREARFRVACDVDNPFYGPEGAAAVFAPQKGADTQQVNALDRGMRHFASMVQAGAGAASVRDGAGPDLQAVPGSGAAGGVGGALYAFLAAPLQSGAQIVLDALGFDAIAAKSDLVITGEGCLDGQSLRGKACYAVLERCRALDVPVLALCGIVRDQAAVAGAGFKKILPVKPEGQSIEEAMRPDVAKANIRNAVLSLFGPGGSFRSPSPGEV